MAASILFTVQAQVLVISENQSFVVLKVCFSKNKKDFTTIRFVENIGKKYFTKF